MSLWQRAHHVILFDVTKFAPVIHICCQPCVTGVSMTTAEASGSMLKANAGNYKASGSLFARTTPVEDKELFASLNNRLASYIDKVRNLQEENSYLSHQIGSFEGTVQREVEIVKRLFETELSDARTLLDALAREKAQLQIDVGKYKSEAEDWMLKHDRKDSDVCVLHRKLLENEAVLAQLEAKSLEASRLQQHWQSECMRVKRDLSEVDQQLATARRQLEQETLLRVDMENRMQSLEEELAFKSQLHETELSGCQERLDISVLENDAGAAGDRGSTLEQALQDFRLQHGAQLTLQCSKIKSHYEDKLAAMKNQLDKNAEASTAAMAEATAYRTRVTELQGKVDQLTSLNAATESRIRELEAELVLERETACRLLASKEAELKLLLDDVQLQARNYRNLLDVKLGLDTELAAYRHLLEGEEQRLNLSASIQDADVQSSRELPRKRRRVASCSAAGKMMAPSSDNPITSSSSAGPLEIVAVNTKSNFIKLYNKTRQEVPLGGWRVQAADGSGKEVVYAFHRTARVDAAGNVLVWGASSGAKNDPHSSNYVMKEGDWQFDNGSLRMVVLNKNAEAVAVAEVSRSGFPSHSPVCDAVDSSAPTKTRKDLCSIM